MSRVSKNKVIYPPTKRTIAAKKSGSNFVRYSVGVYLDNAAATPINSEVAKEMDRANCFYGNPSSFNDAGRMARDKIQQCRSSVAKFFGARPDEIIFTSSGSEANNLAIFGLTKDLKPGEILTTAVEHPSVLEPMRALKSKGWKIVNIRVDKNGIVDLRDLKQKLNSRVVLVSIMYANNEIGSIEPIKAIAKTIHDFRNHKFKIQNSKLKIDERIYPLLHADACQAAEYLDMNVNNLGIDLMTINGTKIYGPRGTGLLYVKRGVKLSPLILGGSHEGGLRAGTENLPGIVGLTKALALIKKDEAKRLSGIRDYFIEKIKSAIPDIVLNGPEGDRRLPNNINISVKGVDSETLLLELDKYRIYAGSGSACTSHSVEPSHVLMAIGVNKEYINGALRLSLGRQTTTDDIRYVLRVLAEAVNHLRKRQGR